MSAPICNRVPCFRKGGQVRGKDGSGGQTLFSPLIYVLYINISSNTFSFGISLNIAQGGVIAVQFGLVRQRESMIW